MGIPYRFDPLGTLGAEPPLPPGYTRVDGVYFDGSSWADIGLTAADCDTWENTMTVYFRDDQKQSIYGTGSSGGSFYMSFVPARRTIYFMYQHEFPASGIVGEKQVYKHKWTSNYVEAYAGDLYLGNSADRPVSLDLGLVLAYVGGKTSLSPLVARFFESRCWRGGEVVSHVIPVKNLDSGELRLYDSIRRAFLTITGSLKP